MNAIDILARWAEYSDYDPEQKSFNLLSTNYEMNRISKSVAAINEFDPTGTMGVLYVKQAFENLCKDVRVRMSELLEHPEEFREDMEMWSLLHSNDIVAVETELLDSIDALVSQAVPTKQLGERDPAQERKTLYTSIVTVVKEMTGLRCELFLRGPKPIQSVSKFSTSIMVYPSLAACLLALEVAEDGLYLCYINCSGSSDSYFSFFLRSNGNLLALSERVPETYPGQHQNTRNGRWQESLKTNLFPYQQILSYSDYDYKGYPRKQDIDEDKLAFFSLGASAYMPILLAMVLINRKYDGVSTENMELQLVDSLFKRNIVAKTEQTKELIIPTGSLVASQNASYVPSLTAEDVLHGPKPKRLARYGEPTGKDELYDEDLFVQLYGDGFELNTEALLKTETTKLIPSNIGAIEVKTKTPCEFIGTKGDMDLIAYQQGRAQLADHIRQKMFEEFMSFGGAEGVEKWWETAVKGNKDDILRLCVDKYNAVQNGTEENVSSPGFLCGRPDDALSFVSFIDGCKRGESAAHYPERTKAFFNAEDGTAYREKYLCPITGNAASIFFAIRPQNWHDLALLVGEENIPKILKGWRRRGHNGVGNPLLSVTDPVTFVGTPFEETELAQNRSYWSCDKWSDYLMSSRMFGEKGNGEDRDALKQQFFSSSLPSCMKPLRKVTFSLMIGFSKRGFNTLLKKYGNDERNGPA